MGRKKRLAVSFMSDFIIKIFLCENSDGRLVLGKSVTEFMTLLNTQVASKNEQQFSQDSGRLNGLAFKRSINKSLKSQLKSHQLI